MMASLVSRYILLPFRLRLFILSETFSLPTLSCFLTLGLDFAHHIKKAAPVSSCRPLMLAVWFSFPPYILAFLGVLFDTSLLLSISLHVGLSVFPPLLLTLTSKNSCSITVSSFFPDISRKVIVYGSLKRKGNGEHWQVDAQLKRREDRWPLVTRFAAPGSESAGT